MLLLRLSDRFSYVRYRGFAACASATSSSVAHSKNLHRAFADSFGHDQYHLPLLFPFFVSFSTADSSQRHRLRSLAERLAGIEVDRAPPKERGAAALDVVFELDGPSAHSKKSQRRLFGHAQKRRPLLTVSALTVRSTATSPHSHFGAASEDGSGALGAAPLDDGGFRAVAAGGGGG